jgi:hypothetical protein
MSDASRQSPFPGMDPYLESRWSDVHAKMIGFIGEAIQPLLPRDLRARAEERLLLEADIDQDPEFGEYRSDVAVIETSPGSRAPAAKASAGAAVVDPIIIRRFPTPTLDRWVQIVDVSNGNRVVTAIEILSPWNKLAGRLNRQYLRKLEDYARANVSVVEIDLLRSPRRGRMAVTEADIPPERRAPYIVCVRLGWEPETWRAYPLPLRTRLPALPIPLRQTDSEILLELQPIIDRIYTAGGHDDIDYTKPPEPALAEADAAWAVELLRRKIPGDRIA